MTQHQPPKQTQKHIEFSFQTNDGVQIYAQSWLTTPPAHALICLVHGFGEHSGRYRHVAARLNNAGFHVLAMDQRGHGRSQGVRGYTPSLEQAVDDIAQFVQVAQKRVPALPTFIYGHSMGGGMVLRYVLTRRPHLAGAISTSPWLQLANEIPNWLVGIGQVLGKVAPHVTIPTQFEDGVLSRDPAVDKAYRADPLVHGMMSAPIFFGLNEAGEKTINEAATFPMPLLLIHGTADKVTSYAASEAFAQNASPTTTTFKSWAGLYHETHNEPEQTAVIDYTIEWLSKQLVLDHEPQ